MPAFDKIEQFQEILRQDSSNSEIRRQLAVVLLDCGYNEEALKHLLYIVQCGVEDGGVYYNLGIAYEKLKKFHQVSMMLFL